MRTPLLTLSLLFLSLTAAWAQTPAQHYITEMQHSAALRDASWGVLAVDREGRVVARWNEQQRLVPASNLKLITTGITLHRLGEDWRFRTEIGYSGEIRDGVLEGDVYIVGHGDPTLGARDSIATEPVRLFGQWAALLREAGIRSIQGRIVGDGSAYEGNLEHQSWGYDDVGTYYGCGSNALCFYENAIDLEVRAGTEGQEVPIRQVYPDTPWMHMGNYSFTGPAGTGNSLYLYTTDLAPYAELRGSFAVDRKPKTEHFANKFGALTCAYYFWQYLKENGWEVSGSYADIDRAGWIREASFVPVRQAQAPQILGETLSPPLREIARTTNVQSDNFYAEALLRALGETHSQVALYDSCLVVQREVLRELGLRADELVQVDGSGLSRMNGVSPAWMVDYLLAMQQSPAFDAFLGSLPQPGEGTLSALLPKLEGRERIRIKSGSMGGVLCYAGYILDADGKPRVTLSLMTNQTTASPAEVRATLSRLLKLLAE